MIEFNPKRWREPKPWRHQIVGARAIVEQRALFLGDVPRIGKSRQVVDAACTLFEAREIDVVVIVGPVAARGVWGDTSLGQIRRFAWIPSVVVQIHSKSKVLWRDEEPKLTWLVTNYDILRSRRVFEELISLVKGLRALLVLDESSAIGSHTSQQSKVVAELRQLCARCVMLNGTPGEPPKLWSQFNILDNVLSRRYKTYTTFKWRYGRYGPAQRKLCAPRRDGAGNYIPGGFRTVHEQVGWRRLDKLSQILAPYTLRRTRKDCPEIRDVRVLYDFKEARLSAEQYQMYKQLKREAIIALSDDTVYMTANAGVKLLRLAQLCSGHLGGFDDGEVRVFAPFAKIELLRELLRSTEARAVIVWTRWRRERELVAEALREDDWSVYELHGGQRPVSRRVAEMAFSSGAQPPARSVVVAQPAAGGMALDMSAASEVYRLSSDYSLRNWEQSNDRPLGHAQLAEHVACTDIVATGCDGQRTVEHIILEALREKRDLARMTCAEWRRALDEE